MTDSQDMLERFHQILFRELTGRQDWNPGTPFTVAEIYRDLVPSPVRRDELGLRQNAEYEHVLLRFLSGEGGFVIMESETVRQRIRQELRSPDPDTGLYRDFARSWVLLNEEVALQEADPLELAV